MRAGILRHLPEPGSALEQSDVLLLNINLALHVWQIDQKEASQHTEDDKKFMRDVVDPPRLKDGD